MTVVDRLRTWETLSAQGLGKCPPLHSSLSFRKRALVEYLADLKSRHGVDGEAERVSLLA